MLKATVILPTTGDRGPLLPYSVGSILSQSLTELEVFIIGDGVTAATREQIHQLQAEDPRVQFFDHPKHPRRGEVYRHQALQQAKGEIVTYLCDRDLMLPNHLEELYRQLQEYNMAATNFYRIARDQTVSFGKSIPFYGPASEQPAALVADGAFVLSSIGHRLDFYQQLPYGWRTTPAGTFTDRYMWQQMLRHPACRMYSSTTPTFLYFKRGHFPGWPLEKRLPELLHWSHQLADDNCIASLEEAATQQLLEENLAQRQLLESGLLYRGEQPATILRRVTRKVATLPKRLLARLQS